MSLDSQNSAPSPKQLRELIGFLRRGILGPAPSGSQRGPIQLCPLCLADHAIVFLHASPSDSDGKSFPKVTIVKDCHDFWVEAMRVLTSMATPADDEAVRTDLFHALKACPIHRSEPLSDSEDRVGRLVDDLSTMLSICLASNFKTSFVGNPTKFRANGAWPTSTADVLPGESAFSSLVGLVQCWIRHGDADMHWLLAYVFRLPIYSISAAALMKVRATFLPVFSARLSALGQSILTLESDEKDGVLDPDSERMATLLNLGCAILHTFPQAKASRREFVIDNEAELLAALDDAHRGATQHHQLLCLDMIDSIRIGFMDPNRRPDDKTMSAMVTEMSANLRDEDPYTRFYTMASGCSKQSKCGTCSCHGYGDVEGVKLLRCSGCRAFRYCSKQCQRAHWKDPILPHSAVCAFLTRMQDIAPYHNETMDKHAFSVACRQAGITVDELVLPFFHFMKFCTPIDHSVEEGIKRAYFTFIYQQVQTNHTLLQWRDSRWTHLAICWSLQLV